MPTESYEKLIVYKRRWFVLLVVAGLNITNAGIWISFASISNVAATYFKVTDNAINWLSIVFFITSIPCGIFATVLCDRKGLKIMIQLGALANLIGATIRVFATLNCVPLQFRFSLTMFGQVIAAIALPFVLVIPTRVSEVWFPEDQRTIATTITSMANPFGTGLGTLLSPYVVNLVPKSYGILTVNIIWAILSLIFAIAAFCIRSSHPPTPPSASAEEKSHTINYLNQIKQLFTNKDYVLVFFMLGAGLALVSAIQTLINQFLCSKGYSNDFAGICGALITGCGIIGAILSGLIADKSKKFEEIAKVCVAFAAISLSVFTMSLQVQYNPIFVAFSCALFGLFAFACLPVALELTAEGTYPVNEALSAGFIIISGQLQAIVYVLLLGSIGETIPVNKRLIPTCNEDMKVPGYVVSGGFVSACLIFITFFKAEYKRRQVEDCRIMNSILAKSETEPLLQ